MSFVDIAYLRRKDVVCGNINYRRHKTKQLMNIKIERCTQEIINRYQNDESDYLFPIIKTVGNEYQEYKNALKLVNVKLKKIGMMIGTPIKLTTYVISVISESMGHTSESTTQIYLSSLDVAIVNQANEIILDKLE
jgi:integrase